MAPTIIFQNLRQENGVINDESKGNYSQDDPIKFLTRSLESRKYCCCGWL